MSYNTPFLAPVEFYLEQTAHRSPLISLSPADALKEAKSFFKYNPSAVKYVLKGSVPDSVRQALEAAGMIVEVIP